jgi:plastocyanin
LKARETTLLSVPKMPPAALLITALLLCAAGSARGFGAPQSSRRSSGRKAQVRRIVIKDLQYQPSTLRVQAGQTIEWKNEDIVPHTATSENAKGAAAFDSGSIAPGQSWRYVAKTKGSFDYLCTFHPNMKAKLIVE